MCNLSVLSNGTVVFVDVLRGEKVKAAKSKLSEDHVSFGKNCFDFILKIKRKKMSYIDWFVINVYANPISFRATLNSLKLSIRFLPNKSKIIMMGDFNALSYDNINSSSILKLNDARIKRFTQLKEQILDCFGFVDFALKNDFCDYTHYDKQHKTFARIDYVFLKFETEYDSMQSIQISISDHLLLHVFVKPSNLYQRGPSYWKLNEEILNNNASLIREDLKNFYENESPSSYENFKHNFRDLLRFIQENKKRVDQKELNLLKYHENVLRDCIHSGKGPNPNLIEKYHLVLEHLQKVSKEKDFSDYRKIQKTLSYTFEGVPKFCSQWTSKNTINSIKRIQVDQNIYHTDEDILNQFRKYFSNIFSNSSTTDSDQLLKTFLSKNKLKKK